MTYDQWKTTDPTDYETCPCGSGYQRIRCYSNEYGVPPKWVCEVCDPTIPKWSDGDDR